MTRTYKPKRTAALRKARMGRAARLRSEGKSLRQIAATQEVSHETVRRDLAAWDGRWEVLDKGIAQSHIARARIAGVPWEYVSLARVAERDSWTCGICREPVPPDWSWEDGRRLMPSLDHVVPIERGGEHLYGNVQLAHFFCNLSKGSGKREPHRPQALTLASFTEAARAVLIREEAVAA